MIAEYGETYGMAGLGQTPWPLFRANVERLDRFDARRLWYVLAGAAGAFGGSQDKADQLHARAYPNSIPLPKIVVSRA